MIWKAFNQPMPLHSRLVKTTDFQSTNKFIATILDAKINAMTDLDTNWNDNYVTKGIQENKDSKILLTLVGFACFV